MTAKDDYNLSEEYFLLVDDDVNDITLASYAWKRVNPPLKLKILCDGEEAICYLKARASCVGPEKSLLPSVMLLDLKMPRCSGFEVLEWRKRNPAVCPLPVIVFSGSGNPLDRQKARSLGADWYWVKPADFEQWVELISTLTSTWLQSQKIPFPALSPWNPQGAVPPVSRRRDSKIDGSRAA